MTEEDLKEKDIEQTPASEPAESEAATEEASDVSGEATSARAEQPPEEMVETETDERLQALEQKLKEVEAKLAEAEQQTAEYLDGWQRAQAAFANFRKRMEAEQSEWRRKANAQLLLRLLPVLDDFRRAFEAVPEAYKDDSWLEGMRLVRRKLESVLESEDVKPIELNPSDAFDPDYHEAVLYQEVPGFEEGQVVAEVETGYTIGNHILRPALVVVAKGSAEAADEEEPAPQQVPAAQEVPSEEAAEEVSEEVSKDASKEEVPSDKGEAAEAPETVG